MAYLLSYFWHHHTGIVINYIVRYAAPGKKFEAYRYRYQSYRYIFLNFTKVFTFFVYQKTTSWLIIFSKLNVTFVKKIFKRNSWNKKFTRTVVTGSQSNGVDRPFLILCQRIRSGRHGKFFYDDMSIMPQHPSHIITRQSMKWYLLCFPLHFPTNFRYQ
jgi:hypothetical protein